MAQAQASSAVNARVQGKIVQCIGAVVDVEFPRDKMPKVYDALKMEGTALTLEVQQQLGDGIVRTIALGSSDGLRRGNMVYNTERLDHGAGGQGHAGPHHGRAGQPDRRARPGRRRRSPLRSTARPRFMTSSRLRRNCWKPASR